MLKKRASGILLHITSLPAKFGIGDLGPAAYTFADFLHQAKQSYWQILPLTPPTPGSRNSPYSPTSAFAGNPLLISPELLCKQGLLAKKDITKLPHFPKDKVDYNSASAFKNKILNTAFKNFTKTSLKSDYKKFCSENKHWLDDFALFLAAKKHFKPRLWNNWPPSIRDRKPEALKKIKKTLATEIEKQKFFQFIFFQQFLALKNYCKKLNIKIIGDIPLYLSFDCADVWANQRFFKLTKSKTPLAFGGVPPDYFSRTSQLWNNPVYNWAALKKSRYKWWTQRLQHNLKLFDLIRLDHFRGFVAYWQVPARCKTAANGKWLPGPGCDFFNTILKHIPPHAIIAEDLGFLTPEVIKLAETFGFPGMKILQFAFGRDFPNNRFAPQNHIENCIVYTGTHDNNTIRGWFENHAKPQEKLNLSNYLNHKVTTETIHTEFINLAMSSVARLAIIPAQDLLGLGQNARMNLPASKTGNWKWKLAPVQLKPSLAKKLAKITETHDRAG